MARPKEGHLFIVRGDLLRLACDAILIPSGTANGRYGHVGKHWRGEPRLPTDRGFVRPAPDRKRRAIAVHPRGSLQEPAIWVGHTGDDGSQDEAWFADAIEAFIRGAAKAIRPHGKDPRPLASPSLLLGVPLVGTGAGGIADRKGEVVREVVARAARLCEELGVDVAMVLNNEESYAAAQQARTGVVGGRAWRGLGQKLIREADRLADLARDRRLVLFLGAGVSIGAGLPSWGKLIELLAGEAGLSRSERIQLAQLDPRDAGRILERRLAGTTSLAAEIHTLTEATRPSLLHQLLASLPCDEAVTTNYDELFEAAWKAAGKQFRSLPHESARDAKRWLLKLHGSRDGRGRERIVLSRDDYLRFEGQGAALAGIVQAMLLTRHMLFVGYSMSDDNFHRLVHQVRDAVGSTTERAHSDRFATALTPNKLGLTHELWQDDISFVSAARGGKDDPRRVAIFLDRVAAQSAPPAAHMLDETYKALFSPGEIQLRDALMAAWTATDRAQVPEPVRRSVQHALSHVGPRPRLWAEH